MMPNNPTQPETKRPAFFKWRDVFFLLIPLVVVALVSFTYYRDRVAMAQADAALEAVACDDAMNRYRMISDNWRLGDFYEFEDDADRQLGAIGWQCDAYEEALALQSSGNESGALVMYSSFLTRNDHLDTPISRAMHARVDEIWAGNDAAALAGDRLCAEIATVSSQEIIDTPDREPLLYAECAHYYAAGGDYRNMLGRFSTYTTQFADHPQRDAYRQQVAATLWEDHPVTDLAGDTLCAGIDTLNANDLYTDRAAELPALYEACGDYYRDNNRLDVAIAMYTSFTDEFPDHPNRTAITQKLADAIVAQADTDAAGEIPLPEAIRVPGAINTFVTVQNDSPEPLRIVLTGPETYVETLPACTTCQTYFVAPPDCPNEGASGFYELVPGTYSVVVSSMGDFVVPFRGTWTLEGGYEYPNCFFIVQRP